MGSGRNRWVFQLARRASDPRSPVFGFSFGGVRRRELPGWPWRIATMSIIEAEQRIVQFHYCVYQNWYTNYGSTTSIYRVLVHNLGMLLYQALRVCLTNRGHWGSFFMVVGKKGGGKEREGRFAVAFLTLSLGCSCKGVRYSSLNKSPASWG